MFLPRSILGRLLRFMPGKHNLQREIRKIPACSPHADSESQLVIGNSPGRSKNPDCTIHNIARTR